MDSGLSFDASSEVYGGEDFAIAAGGGTGPGEQGEVHLVFVVFGCRKHLFFFLFFFLSSGGWGKIKL